MSDEAEIRYFAMIDQGIAMEIVPQTPIPPGLMSIMPEDGDWRKLYPGYSEDKWVEITHLDPRPAANWIATRSEDDTTWILTPWVAPEVPEETLAAYARQDRDRLLGVYDAGISMASRAYRLATTDEEREYAKQKIAELDAYAELLIEVPQQPGFPRDITWPEIPNK